MPGLNGLYQTLDAAGAAGRSPQGAGVSATQGAQQRSPIDMLRTRASDTQLADEYQRQTPQDFMQQAFVKFLNGIGIQRDRGGFSFNGQPLPPEMLSTLWQQFIGWYSQQQSSPIQRGPGGGGY